MGYRTNYQLGADKERRIMNRYRRAGCLSFRSAGSHSEFDIFVLDEINKKIYLIQSKPASMSEKKKTELENSLKHFEGIYQVIVSVE